MILFDAVRATMTGWDLLQGKRLNAVEIIVLMPAVTELVERTLPIAPAPDLPDAVLMLSAEVACGVSSLPADTVLIRFAQLPAISH